MGLGDIETANKTASAAVGMEPGNWHIPLQGASKVRPWPSPGPELRQSRGKLEPDRTPVEVVTDLSRPTGVPRILGLPNAPPSLEPPCPGLTRLRTRTGCSTVPVDRQTTPTQHRLPHNRTRRFLPLGVQCLCGHEPLPPVEGTQRWVEDEQRAGCSPGKWLGPPQAGRLKSEDEDGHKEMPSRPSRAKEKPR